ncbi:ser-Thr-rich glycosyl-phosphatidyl-inositol-anchored membrane family protein [Hirsutella rhossiliensis]|uniref:Ser-Thr-rich glycosyl-phosphatidyl-inositol-anchored membrane family domain-containing protein n=1 Tax=Hirsutella rhossiliensis TaxID=111463 RepID=A0A9P8MWG2_9HYPO|nr:ser-Thr-rich glycosyl-phosphatidyl-inositol-anchored membrane family domain-containing protein [Hirsutella rhossiliensis]KAH0963358.1 ser-Thr-rich glycosyl-phosphatidyl-inositol-anchored membrane family domain-containing protein [Hirsutella rhossiliensis]
MHFSLSAATAALVMAASAFAQIEGCAIFNSLKKGEPLRVGHPVKISWTCASQNEKPIVKIILVGGEEQGTQTDRAVVTTGVPIDSGEFMWTVPDLPPRPFYGFKMIDVSNEKNLQYSEPFQIVGGSALASSSSPDINTTVVSSSASYATPTVPTANAPVVPTSAVVPQAQAPSVPAAGAPAGGVPTRQGNVDYDNKNGTAAVKPNGAATGPNGGVAGGVSGRPNNSTGLPIQTAGSAPLAQAGFLSVFGGVVAIALAL